MGRFRDFLRRVTGISTPLGGISWSPPSQEKKPVQPSPPERNDAGRFSDGDWITAAIVSPERAVATMQRIATSVKARKNASRQRWIDEIGLATSREVSALRERYEAGGETVEERCEACVAKMTADIIEREMTSYGWELDENTDVDPMRLFKEIIRRLMKGAG
jgi:hypothetical protein